MRKRRNIFHISFIILAIGIAFAIFELYISLHGLVATHYTMTSDWIDQAFRIVQITDLHDSEFGHENERLISAVRKENPDLILITGDLVNSKSGEDTGTATRLISHLSQIAPVYFSYGNQEKALEEEYDTKISDLFSEAGAIVLDREYKDIMVKGQRIRLGGFYGYCLPDRYAQENHWDDESGYLKEFQDIDLYTILMCHMPVCWISSRSLYDWNVDCIFSGHAHGGQIRIPFIGGLWAPDQGWFPGRECGIYTTTEEEWEDYLKEIEDWIGNDDFKDSHYDDSYYKDYLLNTSYKPSSLILSRGLGNTDWMPRFNNIPEIVVVDFASAEE